MSSKLIGGDSDFFASLVSWWLNQMLLHTIAALHAAYLYLLVFCKKLGCSPTLTIGAVPISLCNIPMSPCGSWFHLKIYLISMLSHEGIHCILPIALTSMSMLVYFFIWVSSFHRLKSYFILIYHNWCVGCGCCTISKDDKC